MLALSGHAMRQFMAQHELTHLDEQGRAHMVDVGDKQITRREATATAVLTMAPQTLTALAEGEVPKGDVLAVARVAGIQAAKRTSELIPLCHIIALSSCQVHFELRAPNKLHIEARVRASDRTGVEMEALTAVTIAGLAAYDMLKAIDRDMVLGDVMLQEKHGGRRGSYRREKA